MGFGKFQDLGLVQPLTKFTLHRIEHHLGRLALSGIRGDLGGIETDAFVGVAGIKVGLLLGRVATFGPSACLFFKF